MEYILTADGSKKIDSFCIENLKIPSAVLMERAAYSVYEELFVKECMGADNFKNASFTFIAGVGNNGGDALCLARIMFQKKFNVNVYIAGDMNNWKGKYYKMTYEGNGVYTITFEPRLYRSKMYLKIYDGDSWYINWSIQNNNLIMYDTDAFTLENVYYTAKVTIEINTILKTGSVRVS